jgi:hypothetical protein
VKVGQFHLVKNRFGTVSDYNVHMTNEEKNNVVDQSLQKHLQELTDTLQAIESLAAHRTHIDDAAVKLMNAMLTRNYYTGYAILTLSQDYHNGPAALDLARQMIEDMVNLEWMMVNDIERQSEKFDQFSSVDRMNALKAAELINLDLSGELTEDDIAKITDEDKVARQALRIADDEDRRSYNKRDFNQMVNDIKSKLDKAPFTEANLNRILWLYIQGNYKNHTSPNELLTYLQPEDDVILQLKGDMQYALYAAYAVLSTVAMRYVKHLLDVEPEYEVAKTTFGNLMKVHEEHK